VGGQLSAQPRILSLQGHQPLHALRACSRRPGRLGETREVPGGRQRATDSKGRQRTRVGPKGPTPGKAGGAGQPRTKGLGRLRLLPGSGALGAAAALRALGRRCRAAAAAARAGGAVRQRGRQRRCKGRRLRPVRRHARHVLHSHIQQVLLRYRHSHLQAGDQKAGTSSAAGQQQQRAPRQAAGQRPGAAAPPPTPPTPPSTLPAPGTAAAAA
jgi:hypothetical protein